ncbi:stress responsive A/B barrel domain-containing protein [Choanephora cucurbitarum]|nr:stress responsive A/B barrel domain-containing protein [Choanephora cucurbitarum]
MTKVVHIVIVKFKPEVPEQVKEQAAQDILALKDTIPEITAATAGKNFTDRGKGYEWGWVIELAKKEDLPIYSNAKPHQDFLAQYKSTFEDVLAFDYIC